ncbi:hypothetical protein O181_034151 [Austropuccinia psidii MF-1]|uniref:Uncharacterized protein n=1 Tax=Austropuccinia psidii MF-1 TaxID=1389203 RepID=A0A9Q3D5T2_9BASI|nr:hypothetical protein [Austropuccinia psidii MF-1]
MENKPHNTFNQSVVMVFNNFSLIMKEMSNITHNLSVMMNNNCRINQYTPCRQPRKPTTRSTAWLNCKPLSNSKTRGTDGKKNIINSANCNSWSCLNKKPMNNTVSEDTVSKADINSSVHTAFIPSFNCFNLIAQSDSHTKPFRQPTASCAVGYAQERMKNKECSKSPTELAADQKDNTGSEAYSGNTTVNFSSDSDLSPAYKSNTLEEYSNSLASRGINANTIKNDSNPSANQSYANNNNIKSISGNSSMRDLKVNINPINKISDAKSTAETTNTKKSLNKDNGIFDEIKIKNEIQQIIAKSMIGQSTKLKEKISKALKNITTNIDSVISIDKLFFSK